MQSLIKEKAKEVNNEKEEYTVSQLSVLSLQGGILEGREGRHGVINDDREVSEKITLFITQCQRKGEIGGKHD